MKKLMFTVLFLFFFQNAFAAIEVLDFDNPQQEKLYNKLTKELRCLVCQNQDIADSNAELAADLRHKTLKLIKQGKQEEEIKQWMVDRYGDFVLYKPPVKQETLLLWLGPLILFAIALFVVLRIVFKRKKSADMITETQKQKMDDLLTSGDNK